MESNHSIQKSNLLRALLVLIFMAIPLQWATAQLTLSTTRTNLGTVIKQIQSQSKYQFFYNDKLSATQVEAVNVKDASLEQVLNSLLSGTSISYKVEDNIVYLSEKNAQQTNQQQVGQEHTITGQVIDTKGEMLIGVSILQKGTSNGTITDMDGNYTLKVSGEQPVLVFSYIGYKTLEIPGNKPTLNVTMSDDTQVIDEVVVTALGIKREKKMLGYAVQEIKSDQLNKTGDPSVTSALQGKVAGLQMNTAGTGLGGSTKITIRGNSSLSDFLALEDSGTSQCMVVWRMTQSSSIRAAGRTTRMTAILISAPREISRQMLFSSSILLMAATPTVAAKKVRPLVRMD